MHLCDSVDTKLQILLTHQSLATDTPWLTVIEIFNLKIGMTCLQGATWTLLTLAFLLQGLSFWIHDDHLAGLSS